MIPSAHEDVLISEVSSTKHAGSTKPRLFALLVGINAYPGSVWLNGEVSFPRLSGCVPDTQRLEAYLQADPEFDFHPKLLLDAQATKAEVVRHLREHLGQAGAGDVALFYFSGHGTVETADRSIWTDEIDGRLECLACYYENDHSDFLLADKELRFVLHELAATKSHLLTVFDCCHSQGVTRTALSASLAFPKAVARRIDYVFPQRAWEAFIFSENLTPADLRGKTLSELFPEGPHVELTACEADESALEEGSRGVFTRTLLTILEQTGGAITYAGLRNRLRQLLRDAYVQKPRLYTPSGSEALEQAAFLNRPGGTTTTRTEATLNPNLGWLLNLGALHGVKPGSAPVVLFRPNQPDVRFSAQIESVGIDYTRLVVSDPTFATQVHPPAYQADLTGVMTTELKVFWQPGAEAPALAEMFKQAFTAATAGVVELVEKETEADYALRFREDRWTITPAAAPEQSPQNAYRLLTVPWLAPRPRPPGCWLPFSNTSRIGCFCAIWNRISPAIYRPSPYKLT